MALNNIVDVQITRETKAVSQVGFSTMLIAGPSALFTEKIRFYTGIEGVDADFGPTDPEFLAAQTAFSQNPKPSKIAIGKLGVDIPASLSLIQAESDDWYGLVLTSRVKADQIAAAAWIEPRKKLYFARSNDAGVIDAAITTDIAHLFSLAGYARTAVIYHNAATDEFIDAAWLGKMLPEDAGSATFAFKSLTGISANKLTATQETAALATKANVYTSIGGVSVTREGKMASGEYADIMVGVDWLQSRIQERVYSRLVNLKKIPFTDAGVAIIENEIRAQLNDAVSRQVLAASPAFTVSVPAVAGVSMIDRANRFLPSVSFVGTLSGAIHKVQIRGTVAV